MELTLHTAKVIDNIDKNNKGRITLQVLPEMADATKFVIALPFTLENGGTTDNKVFSQNVPAKDSLIWVLVDKYWKRFYYICPRYFEGLFNSTEITDNLFPSLEGALGKVQRDENLSETIEDTIDKVLKIDEQHPFSSLKFTFYENGNFVWQNLKDGTIGIIQTLEKRNPTYVILDRNGNIVSNTTSVFNHIDKNKVEYIDSDRVERIGGNTYIEEKGTHTSSVTGVCKETYKDNVDTSISGDCKQSINGQYDLNGIKGVALATNKDYSLRSTASGLGTIGNSISTLGKIIEDLYSKISELAQIVMTMKTFGSPAIHNVFPADVASLLKLKGESEIKKGIANRVFN